MNRHLLSWSHERGYQVAWGPASVLDVVRRDLERRVAAGEIDAQFASSNFTFSYPTPADGAAVVVVAVPRPAHSVTFHLDSGAARALLPPTYCRYRQTYREVRDDLATHALAGYRVELLDVPLKSLAARLGLVRYGRNNLAYAPGMGSYLQLVGCLTDAPLAVADDWEPRVPRLLDECARCDACRRRCASAAITRERVLLRAEHCLTAVNERAGEWPSWVAASMHHALVGCLACQRVCPANRALSVTDSGVSFSADETKVLMAPSGPRHGWETIAQKFEQLGQAHHMEAFGRNLRAMVEAGRTE